MKKFTMNIAVISIFSLLTFVSFSQTSNFEIRVVENDLGYLDVQMRETTGGGALPSNTDGDKIGDLTFAIRWSDAIGADVAFLCSSNAYNIIDPSGVIKTDQAGWYYRYYNASPAPYVVPTDWALNGWETIATYTVTGNANTGTFEIAPQNFGESTLNITVAEFGSPPYYQYLPTINGAAVGYAFPTVIYDYVWTGNGSNTGFQDAHSWAQAANWDDQCGTARTAAPVATSNCRIPGGLTNYPENVNLAFAVGTGLGNNVLVQSGGLIDFGIPTNQGELLNISGDLNIYGQVNIRPNGAITVSGDTYIDTDQALVVEAAYDATATETQVGSFIDNGTITYGTNGSADVQLHLYYGTPFTGESFYFHQVGPTVDNEPGFSGQTLEDFNLNVDHDFAYIYDESVAPGGQPWVNIWLYPTEIHTASGMMLSTDLPEQHTLDMVGDLLTGPVTSDPLGHTAGGTYLEMISNPYPSAIDFDAFQANNTAVLANKSWIWNAAAHNYFARAAGGGGVQYIQVGQAFFVETVAAGTVGFANTDRVHSTDPFRDVMPNILVLDMESAESSTADQLVIRFEEGATTGYDEAIEAIKWNSMNESAAMIRSIADDGTELSVNVMPELDLQGEMVSVPVQFQTGVAGEYSIIASDLESFQSGTEIWLEDKQNGNFWHNFAGGNDTYTFTASADDPHDRFVVHFFGPTSVNNNEASGVKIYSINEYAHISNLTKNEVVKEVSIYSLAGTTIMHKQVPEQNRYRFFVSNHDGFYIVRVVTDKNIYTEKVFIH